jgi:hypothetical protein
MNPHIEQAMAQFQWSCLHQPRYRVGWIIGSPQSGKSTLARQLGDICGWFYLNYTLTPGYFDTLTDTIASYLPQHLLDALHQWIQGCPAPVFIVDEIDSLLATWSLDQRRYWASQASRMPHLPCGIIITTTLIDRPMLTQCLPYPDSRYYLELAGESS